MKKKMRNISRTVAVLMIAMLTGSIAMAQPGGQQGPPKLPSDKQIEKMVKSLDKELDLSEKQNEQVSDLYFAHFDKVEAKMESSSRPARSEMEALDTDLEKSVKAVLDEEQQTEYTAWLKTQKKQRPQGGQGGQGAQGPPR